jgi:hypothetical protein
MLTSLSFFYLLKMNYITNDHMYGFNRSHKSSNMISKENLIHYWDSYVEMQTEFTFQTFH